MCYLDACCKSQCNGLRSRFVGNIRGILLIMAAPIKSNQWSCGSLATGNRNLLEIKKEMAERRAQLEAQIKLFLIETSTWTLYQSNHIEDLWCSFPPFNVPTNPCSARPWKRKWRVWTRMLGRVCISAWPIICWALYIDYMHRIYCMLSKIDSYGYMFPGCWGRSKPMPHVVGYTHEEAQPVGIAEDATLPATRQN